ncbi:uncharacterized protein I303_101488 [Kwoniella dejecticola CBS 10117]|uniref:U3 small nucleolar RNA-associated protein 19 n=1 Tax=Kwoniella dejecticola CBS 10117 TaxID=1296121 RepID=A0A1A6ADP1_9TREE|nr:U3 small nucleolar RNA-associated protein 19 [Kwoniella dejecticola CBS 10117]OBR88159.1 U3 small nucleolar RNA-associated protein 19 [Kwoniella dejecticola CBS 10117]
MVSSLPTPKSKSKKAKASSSQSKVISSGSTASSNPLNQITRLESTLLGEEYDPNPLVPLIALSRHDDPQIVHKAVWALHRVFIKFIAENKVGGLNGDLTSTRNAATSSVHDNSIGGGDNDLGEEREVKAWVRERLLEYIEVLGGLVRDNEPALRSSSVPLLFSLLPPLSTSLQSTTPLIHIPYLRLILDLLFNPRPSLRGAKPKSSGGGGGWKIVEVNQVDEDDGVLPIDVAQIVVDDFWAKYDDIRWAFFKESSNFIQNANGDQSISDPTNLLAQLGPLVNLPKQSEDINAFYIPSFSEPPSQSSLSTSKRAKKSAKKGKLRYKGEIDELPAWMKEYESEGSESEEEEPNQKGKKGTVGGGKRQREKVSTLSIHQSVYSLQSHKTQYTNLWENVLSYLKLDDFWIRKILVGLHGEYGIMGHFKPERRLRIADWLSTLVDGGGANAMLGMNGLFVLMTEYNFEYPHFYDRLYALLDRNVMHVKYRARFFRLLDTFLASSLLSSALIASFIKRLARLTLSAPPAGIIIILPFIYNLLKRHPGTMVLIQRPDSDNNILKISSTLGKEGYVDPYNAEEKNVLKTHAIDSSLWEIAALQKHYLASISTLAKVFGEVFTKPQFGMEDFLDHGYGTLFDTESNRKIKNPPALSMLIETAAADTLPDLFPCSAVAGGSDEAVVKQGDIVSELWAF